MSLPILLTENGKTNLDQSPHAPGGVVGKNYEEDYEEDPHPAANVENSNTIDRPRPRNDCYHDIFNCSNCSFRLLSNMGRRTQVEPSMIGASKATGGGLFIKINVQEVARPLASIPLCSYGIFGVPLCPPPPSGER